MVFYGLLCFDIAFLWFPMVSDCFLWLPLVPYAVLLLSVLFSGFPMASYGFIVLCVSMVLYGVRIFSYSMTAYTFIYWFIMLFYCFLLGGEP